MNKCSDGHLSTLSEDPWLKPFLGKLLQRQALVLATEKRITGGATSLQDFASGHEHFGLHFRNAEWVFTEWAPNATSIHLLAETSGWAENDHLRLQKLDDNGNWQIRLPAAALQHGNLYRLRIGWNGGSGDRLPAYARRVVQDQHTKIFNAQVWRPPCPYEWKQPSPPRPAIPIIYETHVGMAQEREEIGTYAEFRRNVLPRIIDAGYNAIQLMALLEHPYYGSFGYHVSNFFAASSRFGAPEELKELIDAAHGGGLTVIMDMVHSHAVKNEVEGLSRFDGTTFQYFHEGERGYHPGWDSRCFDYGKPEVLHFLLSNCRYWLDEYHIDGFRFDGITSMLYRHHGLGHAFASYADYFDDSVDADAVVYLSLANKLIHAVNPQAITIAEDVSGMPGLASPVAEGGCGFDYRLAMGVPDSWFKLVNDVRDEDWNMDWLWHELINRRSDERTLSYPESHDQALVGGKTLIFEMIDSDMYNAMSAADGNLNVDRGVALHKMIRLATLATAGHGYLNFMGNEFGHPEWIDFPREGNNWSYRYARRQWSLRDQPELKYHFLADFDREMIRVVAGSGAAERSLPRALLIENALKLVFFERSDLFFLLNFHPSQSLADYAVEVPPGEYILLMDTDETRFGGHGRIAEGQRYKSEAKKDGACLRHFIKVYIPCRVGIVLARTLQKQP